MATSVFGLGRRHWSSQQCYLHCLECCTYEVKMNLLDPLDQEVHNVTWVFFEGVLWANSEHSLVILLSCSMMTLILVAFPLACLFSNIVAKCLQLFSGILFLCTTDSPTAILTSLLTAVFFLLWTCLVVFQFPLISLPPFKMNFLDPVIVDPCYHFWPSVLWHCWLGGRKGIRPVKKEWWGAGVVICLERSADLHMAQMMPLPLTVSCFSKIMIGFTFVVSPG